jgi:hypothetical protein
MLEVLKAFGWRGGRRGGEIEVSHLPFLLFSNLPLFFCLSLFSLSVFLSVHVAVTMDKREVDAILSWLAAGAGEQSRSELQMRMESDPRAFFKRHLDHLPPHLLLPFSKVLSKQTRGELPRIRMRRRNWSQQVKPEELSVEEARRRDPLWYRSINSTVQRRTDGGGSRATESSSSATKSAEPSLQIVDPEDVMEQRRFARVVDRIDEEDVMFKLRRQEGDQTRERDEVADGQLGDEEVEEEEEEEEADEEADGVHEKDSFKEAILADYIRGSVSHCLLLTEDEPMLSIEEFPFSGLSSRRTVSV